MITVAPFTMYIGGMYVQLYPLILRLPRFGPEVVEG